jgi:large subunit ribosomal protein L25
MCTGRKDKTMDQTKIAATTRETIGKEASKKFRVKGSMPAVVYGGELGPKSISVNSKDFESVLMSKGKNVIFTMNMDNGKDNQTVMVVDIQLHPVSLRPIHADFKRVDLSMDVEVEVPITMIANAKGLTDGGVLEHGIRTLHIKCNPTIIPDEFVVDIKDLEIGQNLHVKDIEGKEGIEIISSQDQLVAAILQSKAAASEEETEEDEEGAEEGAEGAEGAEGDKKAEDKKAEADK